MAKEQLSAHGEQDQREDAPQPELRDVHSEHGPEVSSHKETQRQQQRHAALMAYRSQYANQPAGGGLFVPEEEIRERTFAEARHYGLLAGVRYGEPFVHKEVGLMDDLTLLPVQSI